VADPHPRERNGIDNKRPRQQLAKLEQSSFKAEQ